MYIKLPSSGKMGMTTIEMNQPKINHLREIQNLPLQEDEAKTAFVKSLLPRPYELDKLSTYDRDYLFLLAVGVINLNKIQFTVKCSCGGVEKSLFDVDNQEVLFLEEKDEATIEKEIEGVVYTFSILTVAQEQEIVDYALLDEKNLNSRMADAMVASIMGLGVSPESIETVRNYDLSVYFAALFFHSCSFHGIHTTSTVICSKCSKSILAIIPLMATLLSIDTVTIMERFADLSGAMDFKSFIDMSIPELSSLVNSLSNKNK